jgi:hypothetical protein
MDRPQPYYILAAGVVSSSKCRLDLLQEQFSLRPERLNLRYRQRALRENKDIELQQNHYTFGDTNLASVRLRKLADLYEPETITLLRRRPVVRPRVACDLGCGPGWSTRLTAASSCPESDDRPRRICKTSSPKPPTYVAERFIWRSPGDAHGPALFGQPKRHITFGSEAAKELHDTRVRAPHLLL